MRVTPGIFLIAACCAGLQFLSAWFILPAPTTDSAAFVPAAISYARTGKLINPIYDVAHLTDPAGGNRFVFHGPLFPWLVGALSPAATPQWAFTVIAGLRTIALLALAAVFARLLLTLKALRLGPGEQLLVLALTGSCLLAEAGMRLPIVGRPEALGELFVLGATAALVFMRPRFAYPVAALCIGLLGAAHAIGAVMLGVLVAAVIAGRLRPARAVAVISVMGLAACAVTVLILLASPNGLVDSLRGQIIHAGFLERRQNPGLVVSLSYLFFWWDRLFFFSFVMLVPVLCIVLGSKGRLNYRLNALTVGLAVLSVAVVWFAAIRIPETSYNLAMFSSAAMMFLVKGVIDLRTSGHRGAAGGVGAGVFACAVLSSCALLKQGAEGSAAYRAGMTFDRARALVDRNMPGLGCIVAGYNAWPLVDDYSRMRVISLTAEHIAPADCRAGEQPLQLLLRLATAPCTDTGNTAPARVVVDGRTSVRPTVLGQPITKFPAGYSVCVAQQSSDAVRVTRSK